LDTKIQKNLNSIEALLILNSHWFIKDGKAIDWREGFSQFPLDKENMLKERSWQTWVKGFFYLVFSLVKEENECVRGKLVIVCEEICSWKKMCVNKKSMGGSCV
jgi:hypothetical protein